MTTITVDFSSQTAVLSINGVISEETALEFERRLESLFDYYQYRSLQVDINSPGGSHSGLFHILFVMSRARKQGLRIHCKSTFLAASAGALLLALGEVGSRTVHCYTTVLFHYCRAQNLPQVTADSAQHISQAMQQADQTVLTFIQQHLLSGFGGEQALVQEGIARCKLLLQAKGVTNRTTTIGDYAAIKGVLAMWQRVETSKAKAPLSIYEQALKKLFLVDRPLDVGSAYALGLIDLVEGRSEIEPFANLDNTNETHFVKIEPAKAGRHLAMA